MSNHFTVFTPFQYNPGNNTNTTTYLQGIKGLEKSNHYLLVGANNSSGPTPIGLAYEAP